MVVAGIAALIGLALAARVAATADWDPTALIAFGETSTENTAYAEELLGPVAQRDAKGHDGRFFFVQANDPFLLDPDENARILDRPAYRSQRMLYPLLAGGFGLFSPSVIVAAMIGINIVALSVGTWATGRFAMLLGRSHWWGLAFGLNLGLVSELGLSGAGLVAMCAAMLGILAALEERHTLSVLWLGFAVLSREAMLLVAAGVALWEFRCGVRRRAFAVIGLPAAAAATWALYVRWRLDWPASTEVEELGAPFVGFFDAMASGAPGAVSKIIAPVLILLLARYAWHVVRHPSLVGFATVGFVPLALVLTEQVWLGYFDITRAVAPALTGYVLAVFVESSKPQPEHPT